MRDVVIVIENQTFFDIAIQEDGSVYSALDWSIANRFPLTEELIPGMELIRPNSIFIDKDVAEYFKSKNKKIATGFTEIKEITPVEIYGLPLLFPILF
jgi:hypothetical protein